MPLRPATLLAAVVVAAVLPLGAAAPSPSAPGAAPGAAACTDPLVDEAQPAQDALDELPDAEVAEVNDLSVGRLREETADDALWVDPCGRLFVVEETPSATAASAAEAAPIEAPAASDVFALHSRPGAARTLYLDFYGRTLTRTAWNSERSRIALGAYTEDADPTTFTAAERATVAAVWQSVAADYAAWDVDVTTQDPGDAALVRSGAADTRYGMRVVIAGSSDGMQADCGCGGVAYVDVFDRVGSAYQPALVFSEALGSAKAIAEAASHEVGHTLGLFHDGDATHPYHPGTKPWAPIMGVGYSQPVTQWSRGEYPGATSDQDDTAIITRQLRTVPDDHPATTSLADATPLTGTETGLIAGPGDADSFIVEAAGPVTVTAEPVGASSNLDLELVVTGERGATHATVNPAASRVNASVARGLDATASLVPGRYVVTVRGGAGPTYSAYGGSGTYRVRAAGEVGRPALTAAGTLPTAVAGRAYTATVVTGGTPPYTWSGAPLPDGLSFGSDGRITGIPAATGSAARTTTATPTVRDAVGRTVEVGAWTRFVVEPPLAVATTSLPRGVRGRAYTHRLLTRTGPADVRWRVTGLPTGLRLDADGTLRGTPARAGRTLVTFTAVSAGQSVDSRLTLVVDEPTSLRTTSVRPAVVGTAYRTWLGAAGGTGTYRWSARGLPAGLTLSSSGLLSGTPRSTGSRRATVTVASGTTSASRVLTVSVRPRVAVTTRSLPGARRARAYRTTVRLGGGVPAYRWRASGLPRGVTLRASSSGTSAVLGGRPRSAGTFRVTLRVQDGTGRAATRRLTLRVRR